MQSKTFQIISLSLAILISSAGCSATPPSADISSEATIKLSIPAETVKQTKKPITSTNNKKVAKIYNNILDNIKAYTFTKGDEGPFTYSYALALMNESAIPQLLVAQNKNYGVSDIKIFSVNSDFTKEITSDDIYTVGVAPAGGFRGSISQNEACNALLYSSWQSGTGAGVNEELTAVTKNDNLQIEKKTTWEGRIDNAPLAYADSINFVDIADRKKLAELADTPDEDVRSLLIVTNDKYAKKMTVSGVVKIFNHSEMTKYQNIDPVDDITPDNGEQYLVLLLKSPVSITIYQGGIWAPDHPEDKYTTHTVSIIQLPDDMKVYDGQNITVSFNSRDGRWPSEASLPLGVPRMSHVNIVK